MSEEIKKGLLGIVVDETEVSKVMPEINSLTYRGYAAQDLCAKCKFEEVAYLILNGELPNKNQLRNFEKDEVKENPVHQQTFKPLVKNLFTKSVKRGCEWPEGHPDESEFKFCGKDRFEDKPYCIDHCAVAYVIPEKEEEKQHVAQRV